jgi:hypothetical protein
MTLWPWPPRPRPRCCWPGWVTTSSCRTRRICPTAPSTHRIARTTVVAHQRCDLLDPVLASGAPTSLSQEVALVLGAQVGEARTGDVARAGDITRFPTRQRPPAGPNWVRSAVGLPGRDRVGWHACRWAAPVAPYGAPGAPAGGKGAGWARRGGTWRRLGCAAAVPRGPSVWRRTDPARADASGDWHGWRAER